MTTRPDWDYRTHRPRRSPRAVNRNHPPVTAARELLRIAAFARSASAVSTAPRRAA